METGLEVCPWQLAFLGSRSNVGMGIVAERSSDGAVVSWGPARLLQWCRRSRAPPAPVDRELGACLDVEEGLGEAVIRVCRALEAAGSGGA